MLSASPSAGRACVVLLLQMPMGEVSFARLGDDRWTCWVDAPGDGTELLWRRSGGKKTQRWAGARLNLLSGYSPLDRTAHEITKFSRAVLHWPNLSLATLGSR